MSTETGRQAEESVAQQLKRLGMKVVAQNWRMRRVELDIVAETGGERWFVEVKYRIDATRGGGFESVTAARQRQLRLAALSYLHEEGIADDRQNRIFVAEVLGQGGNADLLEVLIDD